MTEHKFEDISSTVDLLCHVKKYSNNWIFRGQGDIAWPLWPKASRLYRNIQTIDIPVTDGIKMVAPYYDAADCVFRNWCDQAPAYGPVPSNEFELLALAQHHGLATRLLDWSTNPLVALFFAVESETLHANDGAIFCYYIPNNICSQITTKDIPPNSNIIRYTPRPVHKRIIAQSATFTWHRNLSESIKQNKIEAQSKNNHESIYNPICYRIKNPHKADIFWELSKIGINRASLFPDLDGLSAKLNRPFRKKPDDEYWDCFEKADCRIIKC